MIEARQRKKLIQVSQDDTVLTFFPLGNQEAASSFPYDVVSSFP